jgi:hypothetical protein
LKRNAIELERATIVKVLNAKLINNFAPDKGAGVLVCQSCFEVTIDNVEAYNNRMKLGGVFTFNNIAGDISILNSEFYNNRATLSGGVIIASGL